MDLANHFAIFKNVGVEPLTYPYYDPKTIGLDYEGFVGSLTTASPKSIFLLHACAHNPTGVDPTKEQWNKIADVMLEKGHYAFFDCAYQGFASGNLDNDAWAVREFVKRGVPMLVCQVCTPFHSARIIRLTMGCRALPRTLGCMASVLVHFTSSHRRRRLLTASRVNSPSSSVVKSATRRRTARASSVSCYLISCYADSMTLGFDDP